MTYQIICKKLNSDSKILLIIIVGVSYDSFCNNLKILNNNIHKIKKKYSEIIFFLYEEKIKEKHKKYINTMKEKEEMKKYSEEQQMYVINDLMREIIASHYDKIIRRIIDESSYTGIDLLGVSSKNLAF